MDTIVLRHLDRLSTVKGLGEKPSTCLWMLSGYEFQNYADAVIKDLKSGLPEKIRKYLQKIPPGNNQTFSDPLKVFKLWEWSKIVKVGIAVDFQQEKDGKPFLKRQVFASYNFFLEKEDFFANKIGCNNFFSSGAIVVYRK